MWSRGVFITEKRDVDHHQEPVLAVREFFDIAMCLGSINWCITFTDSVKLLKGN